MMQNLYYYDKKHDIRNKINGLSYDPNKKQLYFYNFSPSPKSGHLGWFIYVNGQGIFTIALYFERYDITYNINDEFKPFGVEMVNEFSVGADDYYSTTLDNKILKNKSGHIISCLSDSEVIELPSSYVNSQSFYDLNAKTIIFENNKQLTTLNTKSICSCPNLETIVFNGKTSFSSNPIWDCPKLKHIICSDAVDATNLEDMILEIVSKNCTISYLAGEVKGDNKIKLR